MSSEKINFISYGETTDGTNYCTAVETFASNIIEGSENDAVVVYPSKNGWATARNDDTYRVTTDDASIELPYPIYKLQKVTINVGDPVVTGINGKLSLFKDKNGKYITDIDITSHILLRDARAVLPFAKSYKEYFTGIYKDNTFAYEVGEKKIILSYQTNDLFLDKTPVYDRLIRSIFYSIGDKYFVGEYGDEVGSLRRAMADRGSDSLDIDVREWKFRIEYIPMTNDTKIRARKSTTATVDYVLPYNQRAEINNASALGKSMWLTAQKTGMKELTLVKRYEKISDIPPVGSAVKHNGKTYKICANHYSMTNTVYIQVTHTLSENWTMRSNHVSVDQKYRNWKIPQDTLWRTLYDEITIQLNLEGLTDSGFLANIRTSVLNTFSNDTVDNCITHICWTPKEKISDDYTAVLVPCLTYGVANSMVISASFKDNLSAGLRRNSIDGNIYCEDVMYCKSDGTLDVATIGLISGLTNNTSDDALNLFPASNGSYNTPSKTFYYRDYQIYKDAGEALKYTMQLHFITNEPRIIIGSKLAEYCPLIKKWDTDKNFKIILLEKPLSIGVDYIEDKYVKAEVGYSVTLNDKGTLTINADTEGSSGWCICDKNRNLIVGCNDANQKTIYVQVKRVQGY